MVLAPSKGLGLGLGLRVRVRVVAPSKSILSSLTLLVTYSVCPNYVPRLIPRPISHTVPRVPLGNAPQSPRSVEPITVSLRTLVLELLPYPSRLQYAI